MGTDHPEYPGETEKQDLYVSGDPATYKKNIGGNDKKPVGRKRGKCDFISNEEAK